MPASFCNLVGLRPTVGLISRAGLSPLVKTQDTPGPMTRTARDAALMLDVMVGCDPKDPHTDAAAIAGPPRGGSYAANFSPQVLTSSRIGVLHSVFGSDADPECASVNAAVRSALAQFSAAGTTLVDIEIPNLDYYLNFTPTYLSRSRYDIDAFLSSHPHLSNKSLLSIHAAKAFHPALPLFDRLGSAPATPYADDMYAQRLAVRDDFEKVVRQLMAEEGLDAIAYPSVRIPAPTTKDVLGERFRAKFPENTSIASQLHMPAISVPVGFTGGEEEMVEGGLPVGLELLGVPFSEQKLLELAFGIEGILGARRAPKF